MKHTRIAKRAGTVAASIALAGLALSGCAAPSPSTEGTPGASPDSDTGVSGTLNLIAYASIWQEQYQAAVIDPFLEKYPEVTVNYVSKRSSAEMLSALQSEGGTPTTDVAIMDISVANTGNTGGLFQTLDESDIPNLANVKPEFQNEDGYGPVVMADAVGLLYDTEEFEKAPTSWEVLWDDEYAGRVAIVAPPSGLGINLTAITAEMEGEDFTESIDAAVARLKELAPNVQSWAPNPDEYQSIITGQTVLGIGQNARGQYYSDESDRLGITIPEEGTVYQLNTINIREGAPNEEVAKLFTDYALSAEAQTAFAEALFYAPAVTNAELPDDVADRVVQTDGSTNIIEIDQEWLSTVRDEWTDRWKREIIGG